MKTSPLQRQSPLHPAAPAFLIACILLLISVPLSNNANGQLLTPYPEIYPGAVPQFEGSATHFVSKDSFDQVLSFYVRKRGAPTSEQDLGNQGKTAWFKYVDQLPDPGGLTIAHATKQNRSVSEALRNLENVMTYQKAITKEEFDAIKTRFDHLRGAYFIQNSLDNGRTFFKDEIIYRRCHDRMTGGSMDPAEMERMVMQANELMMSGRTQEGLDLIEEIRRAATANIQGITGRPGADMWIKCLEEMEENAYSVAIRIVGM